MYAYHCARTVVHSTDQFLLFSLLTSRQTS